MKKTINPMSRMAVAVGAAAMLGLAPAAFAADETVALKNALYGAGYSIANVSPTMDDATKAALKKFQMDSGIAVTGAIDDATKKALGIVSVQIAAAASTSSAPAKTEQASASAETTKTADTKAAKDAAKEDEDDGWSLW
ncbi:peptidoglycan-binding domain-containing protein [Marinobacter sp. F4216]|uniref:peptidoglycan-binding domain-containing protein n=1 Tax=Marinobacter sp. F4216 TaxID=2874281 RepID=UPI001CBCF004|nr:peptidoglycan-binding domain-containing protein [Marinobacter sp. F4216]MBZ2167191.1 peptidoglycan-binding protein [Marinobacter sp. F4216]